VDSVGERLLLATHKSLPLALLLACVLAVTAPAMGADSAVSAAALESGYHEMYNLDFDGAHTVFQLWEASHPDDALGPVSNAAAYLFAEFDRLHILESELFTNDQRFAKRQKLVPDPETRAAFDRELARGEEIAGRILSTSPQDTNALFAKTMASGLRGDYAAMIEKRNLAGLGYIKAGRVVAQKLLAFDPSYYDAYLALGVENYLLGLSSAPVRWLLRLGGAETNKDDGIAQLRLTAEKGHYLAPYARLLLAVAALRDHDRETARRLLAGLAEEFPQNQLYRNELARLQP
jgi:hypothetical protein